LNRSAEALRRPKARATLEQVLKSKSNSRASGISVLRQTGRNINHPMGTTVNKESAGDLGGMPVRQKLLPYGRQAVDEGDIAAVAEALRSDWLTTGPRVENFEEAFAGAVGAKFAVSFSSGTAALHGAAFAAGLGPGDEAVTTPMTSARQRIAVLYQRARPFFAMCPQTL